MRKYSNNYTDSKRSRENLNKMHHRSRILFASVLMILCGCMYFGMAHVSAKESSNSNLQSVESSEICYTSRLIEPGDSLWSIAEENLPARYSSVNEYVSALKEMNHLESDTIHAGQYLMIVCEK